jgi:RimJ/RimL family protein N-acetyltransferase
MQENPPALTALPPAPPLENAFVRLEPLRDEHREELRLAASGDPAVFAYMPADLSGGGFDAWMEWSLAQARDAVWAVRARNCGTLAGSTRFLNADLAHRRVEIGYTWYARPFWSGPVNPSCKFLLFQYGFETLGLNRIELKTDARNARSRAAIAKLGAREEGTLRAHMIVQHGHVRDTVYFSVIRPEWPSVRAGLLARLAAFA